ncbi:MAG: DNA adenine methylase [Acidobacteria bacterium]|nr:DNA adenine methylase [Acidobacteriota bacterium]
MTKTPHPIPYQGSKRLLSTAILKFFPPDATRLIEPFAGAAAVSLAAARRRTIGRIILNDINEPLMNLWREIIERPEKIASSYKELWTAQLGKEREYYDLIRTRFNVTRRPHYFLYLLARCVKASVRYNSEGQFNQSPDNRRKGMNPETMRWHLLAASRLLRGITLIRVGDYKQVLQDARPRDIVYMDPPYQGVCANRDPRYIGALEFEEFATELGHLNERRIAYILSYDGRTGDKSYGRPMPKELGLLRLEIDAGLSSQATLLGRKSTTYESIYLSPALVEKIETVGKRHLTIAPKQERLWAHDAI